MPSNPLFDIIDESLCFEYSVCGVAVNYCLLRPEKETNN